MRSRPLRLGRHGPKLRRIADSPLTTGNSAGTFQSLSGHLTPYQDEELWSLDAVQSCLRSTKLTGICETVIENIVRAVEALGVDRMGIVTGIHK